MVFNTPEYKKAIFVAKKTWLKAEIKNHFRIRDNLAIHLKVIHTELLFRLHSLEFDWIWSSSHEFADILAHQQYVKQKSKLSALIFYQRDNNVPNRYVKQFYSPVINLSTVQFSEREEAILKEGINYAPKFNMTKMDLDNLAIYVDAAVPDSNIEAKRKCVDIIKKNSNFVNISTFNYKSVDQLTLKSFKDKVKRNNLIITKADKGQSICILSKCLYVQKVLDCLSKMSLEEVNVDPTKKFNKFVHETINKCNLLFSKKEKLSLKNSNPTVPILYGLIKTHKIDMPVRPVCSSFNSPSQYLGKKLCSLLPQLLDITYKYTIKNSLDLIDKIKDINIPHGAKLVSFDVVSLFTSIPIDKLKKYFMEKLIQKISNTSLIKEMFDLVNLCLTQNYFYFNNKYYIQKTGVAMGASISPFFSDFYMDVLEQKLFNDGLPYVNKVLGWYRYVDDIFCIWLGSLRQLNCFLNNTLNKLDDKIKFTMEVGDASLNFLDINVNILNNSFKFNIYRKPTFTDIVIPNSSIHPLNIKTSAFHAMLNRLINIPLNYINYRNELNVILQIATSHGYTKNFIYNLLKLKQKKLALKLVYPLDNSNFREKIWRKIPYIGPLSDILGSLLKEYNILPAFFCHSSLRQILFNNKLKPERDKTDFGGVYSIACNDCNAVYIGKTKRSIGKRFSEHIIAAKYNRPASGLSNHLIDTGHSTSPDKLKLIYQLNGGIILDKYEIFCISCEKEKGTFLMNDLKTLHNISPLINIFKNS